VLHDLVSELAMEILFGKSSDTYQELYEERLILDDFGASYGIGAGIGYGIIGGDTPEPDRLRDGLLERIRRLIERGSGARTSSARAQVHRGIHQGLQFSRVHCQSLQRISSPRF